MVDFPMLKDLERAIAIVGLQPFADLEFFSIHNIFLFLLPLVLGFLPSCHRYPSKIIDKQILQYMLNMSEVFTHYLSSVN